MGRPIIRLKAPLPKWRKLLRDKGFYYNGAAILPRKRSYRA